MIRNNEYERWEREERKRDERCGKKMIEGEERKEGRGVGGRGRGRKKGARQDIN